MSKDRLFERFTRLCEISSPTGHERPMADELLRELGELGIDAQEDAAAAEARSDANNVIATIPGESDGCIKPVLVPSGAQA